MRTCKPDNQCFYQSGQLEDIETVANKKQKRQALLTYEAIYICHVAFSNKHLLSIAVDPSTQSNLGGCITVNYIVLKVYCATAVLRTTICGYMESETYGFSVARFIISTQNKAFIHFEIIDQMMHR